MMRTNDGLVKQEVDDGVPSPASDSDFYPPLPLQGLHDPAPPPFLNKTYDMVDDPNTDEMVSWSLTGGSFIVWDSNRFSMELLPKFFKDNNFSSFVRQLNMYGFRKVDPDRWEFASEGFFRGHKHLLITIKRRKPPSQTTPHQAIGACVEVGHFGLEGEIDRLKRDKAVLMSELVKLRQQQQNTRDYMKAMEERIQGTEQKQHQMMAFLARAMQNPTFVMQMLQQSEKRKELEEAISKKRRRPIEGRTEEEEGRGTPEELAGQQGILLDMVSSDLEDGFDFDLSELERIETELKGEIKRDEGGEQSGEGASSAGLGFLNELWGGVYLRNRNPNGVVGDGGERNTDMDVRLLTEKLGFLGSSPK